MTLMASGAPLALAATNTSTSTSIIPAGLVSFVEQHAGTSGCVSGTLDPFTITSTVCPTSSNDVSNGFSTNSFSTHVQNIRPIPASTYSISCTGVCLAGTDNTASNYYALWDAFATVPTVPSTLYTTNSNTGAPYVSNWIGLSTCVPSCTGTYYGVQGGISFGADGSSDSHHPGLWVQYVASSGTCSGWCGNYMSTNQGDSDNWEMKYLSASTQWLLYGQDSTLSTYVTYYEAVGGSGNMPYSTLQYALVGIEGHGVNSAGYWPGTVTYTSVVGEDSSGSYQLGTQGTNFEGPSGTTLTASISYSTSSCYAGTCAAVGLGVT